MQSQLLLMLLLASTSQVRSRPEPLAEPPGRRIMTVRLVVRFETRELTVSWPTPPLEEGEPPQRPMRLNLNTAVVEPVNFDRWLFEDAGFEMPPQQHLDEVLRARLDAAAREYDLTTAQRLKLQLAGKGDIKHFFDQVEERRREFEEARRDYVAGMKILKGLNDLSPIYTDGPFGVDSLFAKTLRRIREDQKGR
jgi:hypothetical protein